MLERSVFQNISPLDHRYSLSEKEVFNAVGGWLSEDAAVRACLKAESALVAAHLHTRGKLTEAVRRQLDEAAGAVSAEEVYREEEKNRHNIRALVNALKRKMPDELRPLVHLGATSVDILASALKGKLAGAVGAYNALCMITADPLELEKVYLAELGLEPSEHSTQLVEPEYLLRLLLEINTAFGVIANLADDLRHLQRSEISELREGFASAQVGSSTMPQKRNPWNSEHVKSLWKAFMPRVITFYMKKNGGVHLMGIL